ncbi:MAG TPA: UDP-N-acetylglucosamine 2-epimerase, partial [Blastocatellia bacterium]|nr:UDP-N-acetylglucosamine 2-epimerase [Blastocatellia bacterium]
REVTERPEVIEAGAGKIVGTDPNRIYEECARLLTDSNEYERMSNVRNPFGDGQAATRIVRILDQML